MKTPLANNLAEKPLRDWAVQVLGDVNVTLAAPTSAQAGQGISLYLMELASAFPSVGSQRPPLKMELRYLVTAWAQDPEQAHRLLFQLAFAAMENAEFEVDLTPLPPAAWLAFATAPRPSFILRVPLRMERTDRMIPFVKAPMLIRPSPVASLEGRVLGPSDLPLAGARVQVPPLELSVVTDAKGRFRFMALPSDPPVKYLRISAKGRELDVNIEQAVVADEPLVIHFDLFNVKGE